MIINKALRKKIGLEGDFKAGRKKNITNKTAEPPMTELVILSKVIIFAKP